MKLEIIILLSGIIFACCKYINIFKYTICILFLISALPFYSDYLRAKYRLPTEVNIDNIKNRKKSDYLDDKIALEHKKIEKKLSQSYTKDDKHSKIKKEIEKTYKELYNQDYKL
jgi:hypothetical protein